MGKDRKKERKNEHVNEWVGGSGRISTAAVKNMPPRDLVRARIKEGLWGVTIEKGYLVEKERKGLRKYARKLLFLLEFLRPSFLKVGGNIFGIVIWIQGPHVIHCERLLVAKHHEGVEPPEREDREVVGGGLGGLLVLSELRKNRGVMISISEGGKEQERERELTASEPMAW